MLTSKLTPKAKNIMGIVPKFPSSWPRSSSAVRKLGGAAPLLPADVLAGGGGTRAKRLVLRAKDRFASATSLSISVSFFGGLKRSTYPSDLDLLLHRHPFHACTNP